jgi:hypothetical protein
MFVYVVTFNELVYGVFTSREKAQRAIRKYVDNEEEGINENSFFINQRKEAATILPVHALTTFITQILLWMKLIYKLLTLIKYFFLKKILTNSLLNFKKKYISFLIIKSYLIFLFNKIFSKKQYSNVNIYLEPNSSILNLASPTVLL